MFEKLTARERLFVLGGGGFVFIAAVVFIFQLILDQRATVRDEVQRSSENLRRITNIRAVIENLPERDLPPDRNEIERIISSQLDRRNLTPRSSVSTREDQDTERGYQTITVSVRINGSSLVDLIRFLYDIEYNRRPGIQIGNMNMRRSLPDRNIYDMDMDVVVRRPLQ